MEKLIELLNEYEKHISLGGLADWREFDGNLHYYSNYKDEYVFDNVYYRITSKNYGFIKWLVKNDKIDWEQRQNVIKELWTGGTDEPRDEDRIKKIVYYSEYESLLILLSIQDEPINFLISILK